MDEDACVNKNMDMILWDIHRYINLLGKSIPAYVFEISVIIIILCFVFFIAINGIKKGLKYYNLAIIQYFLLILSIGNCI